jgi:hypothetical protein
MAFPKLIEHGRGMKWRDIYNKLALQKLSRHSAFAATKG